MSCDFCPVCRNELSAGYQSWHLLCKHCGYEKADFRPTINLHSAHLLIDENAREAGLRDLRIRNFGKLLTRIKSLKSTGGRLLDVGCAHGWFLELAKKDFDVMGLEPDKHVFDSIHKNGLPIRMGYFPDVLGESEKFDVIVFNDVLEHIPDIDRILACCHQRLNREGLLVINLPNSSGIFYRLSKVFCRCGLPDFFERLWQKGLPSPHLHYFNSPNLVTLLKNKGFEAEIRGSLPTLRLPGLYTRISYTGDYGFTTRAIIYICIVFSLPLLKILPSDIIYIVSKRD